MTKLARVEQETLISQDATDRSVWLAYSSDPATQKKFERAGAEIVREDDWGKEYRLAAGQVIISKKRRRTAGSFKPEVKEHAPGRDFSD